MSDANEGRQLGFWMCLALVVGTFIGSGIFLLPAQLAPFGWNALVGWLVTISGALCLAWLFGKLARALPLCRRALCLCRRGLRAASRLRRRLELLGFDSGSGNAAIAVAAVSYLSSSFPALASDVRARRHWPPSPSLWLLTAVNCISVRAGGRFQLVTVVLKLVPLAGGDRHRRGWSLLERHADDDAAVRASRHQPVVGQRSGGADLMGAARLRGGVDRLAQRQGSGANVPRATMIGTLDRRRHLPARRDAGDDVPAGERSSASNAPFATFVGHYWSPTVGGLIGLFAAISAIGALNGLVLIQGELPLAMARDGAFPEMVRQDLEPRHRSPRAALVERRSRPCWSLSNYSAVDGRPVRLHGAGVDRWPPWCSIWPARCRRFDCSSRAG